MELTLDPARFRKWLEDRSHGDYVGTARTRDYCPIATWMRRDLAFRQPLVSIHHISFNAKSGDVVFINTPEWVSRFIDLIDGDLESDEEVNVWRDEALEALNVVEGVN